MAELPKSNFFGKLGFFVLTFKAYCIIDDITTWIESDSMVKQTKTCLIQRRKVYFVEIKCGTSEILFIIIGKFIS